MRYLHIMTGANYVYVLSYIKFINEHFSQCGHVFIIKDVYNNMPSELSECKNVICIPNSDSVQIGKYLYYIYKAETIIWHLLSISFPMRIFFLLQPWIIKKSVWMVWGGDLYNWEKICSKVPILQKAIGIAKNYTYIIFVRKLKSIIVSFFPDSDTVVGKFRYTSPILFAHYPLGYNIEFIDSNIQKEKSFDGITNIMIGHSATHLLKHCEVLNKLLPYKNENIRIYLPLNYGTKSYGDMVENYAKELYGNKAIAIRHYMKMEEYIKFLIKMDIAIINADRQIALGNIILLCYLQKKIYLANNGVMFQYFKEQYIEIGDADNIGREDFISFKHSNDLKGKEYALTWLDEKKLLDLWKAVFERI